MLIPLGVLAFGALFAGLIFGEHFIGHSFEEFWKEALSLNKDNHIMHDMHDVALGVGLTPTFMMVGGFVLAWLMYVRWPGSAARLAQANPILYNFLLNKWYFDELYDFLFVRPAFAIGRLFWKGGDGAIIDGMGPDGIAAGVLDGSSWVVKLQTGYVYHYAFAMMIGVAAFISWYLVGGVH